MATTHGFHPEALFEYAEATNYYLREASVAVADRFVASVESAVAAVVVAASSNHTDDLELGRRLDKLSDKLQGFIDKYDDWSSN